MTYLKLFNSKAKYYESETGTAVEGTCAIVALTSFIEFYKKIDNFNTNSRYSDTFVWLKLPKTTYILWFQ